MNSPKKVQCVTANPRAVHAAQSRSTPTETETKPFQWREHFLTFQAKPGDEFHQIWCRFLTCSPEFTNWHILRQDLFGWNQEKPSNPNEPCCCRQTAAPLTWITEGANSTLAGLQIHALAGPKPRPILHQNHRVGAEFQDAHCRYLVLGNVLPCHPRASRQEQASSCFNTIHQILTTHGWPIDSLVRTWFYIENILAWYAEFNRIRDRFFREHNLFTKLVPASTGVGAQNLAATAIVANALAVQPLTPDARMASVPSPLQCAALEYGSSFSRAVQINTAHYRRLLISGTASIAPNGQTLHPYKIGPQIDVTMRVVGALLKSRGFDWTDVTRAIAYFKQPQDGPAFDKYRSRKQIPPFPLLQVKSDICRAGLLFELELDAIKTGLTQGLVQK